MYIQEQVHYVDFDDDILSFFRSISVNFIHLELRDGGADQAHFPLMQRIQAGQDCTNELEQAREQVESQGMKLNNIFMPCWEEIALGKEDQDEQIGHWCRMLESLGKAGIPCLGWNFKPMGNFRTRSDIGRGGASYSTFDYERFNLNRPESYDPPVSADEMWANMETFLKILNCSHF